VLLKLNGKPHKSFRLDTPIGSLIIRLPVKMKLLLPKKAFLHAEKIYKKNEFARSRDARSL